jgi:hypothetical protein
MNYSAISKVKKLSRHRKGPKTTPTQLLKPESAPFSGNIDSGIRRSRESVVEGGAAIGFSANLSEK